MSKQHVNSLVAYQEEVRNFNKREALIYGFLCFEGRPMTDREIRNKLFGVHADMNRCRPRITDLKKRGWVTEVGRQKDPATGKSVRLVRAVTAGERAAAESVEPLQSELNLRIA